MAEQNFNHLDLILCVSSPDFFLFFFNDTATTEIYTLSLHDALPIFFHIVILLQRQLALSVRAVLAVFVRLRNHSGGGDGVAFFHFDQPHTLRRAPCLAYLARFEANDLPVLGDDHDIGLFLRRKNRHHLAIALAGLHVDDALAAARGQAVILQQIGRASCRERV